MSTDLHVSGPFYGRDVNVPTGATCVGTGGTPLQDNVHTIIVYNNDSTETLYVGWDVIGNDISNDALQVPPSTSITLPIGRRSIRVAPTTNQAGGTKELVFQHTGTGALVCVVNFIVGLES